MAIKKYSKVKFTLRKELIIILAVIVVMVGLTILLLQPTKEQKFINKWTAAGSTIVENKVFEEVDIEDLDDVIAKEGVTYVFFVNTTNANGVKAFDKVNSIATNERLSVDKIYLVDSSFAEGNREEDKDLNNKLTEIENKYNANSDIKVSLDAIDMWSFKDGKVTAEFNQDLVEANASDYTEVIKQILLG